MRITIKAWMSSNFSQIQPLTGDLAVHECLKNQCTCNFVSTLVFFFLDWIFILAGKHDYHNSFDEFHFQPDQTSDSRVSYPSGSEKIPIDVQ